jgi:hypothetical protein
MATACLIPTHPRAAGWAERAMAELRDRQLATWSDENGGWREAPHYAMASYDCLVGCFLMAKNAGFGEPALDPRMRKIAEWFAKTSTPPDPALNGRRHLPPIGNTWVREGSGEFGLVSYLWRLRDPEFAAHMQWMHRQQGSLAVPGSGGFFPTLAGYRTLMRDEGIPVRAPNYGSELFPETGVVLRSGFPGPRETQLLLIAGRNHDHYDHDSGSFTLWGKGRVLADDFGYKGQAPGSEHSMLIAPDAPDSALMRLTAFATTEHLDFVHGVKRAEGRGTDIGWDRRIVFVKSIDGTGSDYFVVRDSLAGAAPGAWRLWLTARAVEPAGPRVHVHGVDDVDLDVYFVRPERPAVTTDSRTQIAPGTASDGVFQNQVATTQTAIVVPAPAEGNIVTVLYPRMKAERPPTVTPLAGGAGVKVQSGGGRDYVFLTPSPMEYRDGDVTFHGTVGAVQQRGSRVVLSLGEAGTVKSGRHILESKQAASFSEPNVKPGRAPGQ